MTPMEEEDYKFSAEQDQLGSWESLSALLSAQEFEEIGVPGTLEHDANLGGIVTFGKLVQHHCIIYCITLPWRL